MKCGYVFPVGERRNRWSGVQAAWPLSWAVRAVCVPLRLSPDPRADSPSGLVSLLYPESVLTEPISWMIWLPRCWGVLWGVRGGSGKGEDCPVVSVTVWLSVDAIPSLEGEERACVCGHPAEHSALLPGILGGPPRAGKPGAIPVSHSSLCPTLFM